MAAPLKTEIKATKMNNILFGFIAILAVIAGSVEGSWQSYMLIHSLVIVFGGTAAILVFSTPAPVLKSLWLSIKKISQKEPTSSEYTQVLASLSSDRSKAAI